MREFCFIHMYQHTFFKVRKYGIIKEGTVIISQKYYTANNIILVLQASYSCHLEFYKVVIFVLYVRYGCTSCMIA